jgi:hypothetical protein
MGLVRYAPRKSVGCWHDSRVAFSRDAFKLLYERNLFDTIGINVASRDRSLRTITTIS